MKDDEEVKAAIERIRASGVLPGQKYRHHATQTVYVVTAVGLNEPDLEPLVHYRDAADEYAIVWTRQLHVFCGRAFVGNDLVPRFARVE